MNKKECVKAIVDGMNSRLSLIIQDRPYTCVRIVAEYDGVEYLATGFSKVMWPDTWSEQTGIELAVKRAKARLARQIYDDYKKKGKKLPVAETEANA